MFNSRVGHNGRDGNESKYESLLQHLLSPASHFEFLFLQNISCRVSYGLLFVCYL